MRKRELIRQSLNRPLHSKAHLQRDPEIIGAIIALRDVGWSAVRIGKTFKLAPSTIANRIQQYENSRSSVINPTFPTS